MKFIKSAFVLLNAALFVAACSEIRTTNTDIPANTAIVANANVQPSATSDELTESRKIYAESCAACHRENGTGGASEFGGKKIKVPNFQSKGAMNSSDERLYEHIAEGEEDEMPAFKDKLTEEQMRNLVKYIRREFQKK